MHELTELVAPPANGRTFTGAMRPGLADCAPSGRIRLDALARWLQDLAYADVEDAGLAQTAVWVVRRMRIRVNRFPRFGEDFGLVTFCSGLGRAWAERRTTAIGDGDAGDDSDAGENGGSGGSGQVEAVALWVHLDPDSGRPTPFSDLEVARWGDAAAGRRVTARLRHPPPPASGNDATLWRFRSTECDIADHVNNAAYWQPLEEELLAGPDLRRIDVEMEFKTPAQPGEKSIVRAGQRRWIVSREGEAHASLVIAQLDHAT
jgi:acyl-ACP thioesterase